MQQQSEERCCAFECIARAAVSAGACRTRRPHWPRRLRCGCGVARALRVDPPRVPSAAASGRAARSPARRRPPVRAATPRAHWRALPRPPAERWCPGLPSEAPPSPGGGASVAADDDPWTEPDGDGGTPHPSHPISSAIAPPQAAAPASQPQPGLDAAAPPPRPVGTAVDAGAPAASSLVDDVEPWTHPPAASAPPPPPPPPLPPPPVDAEVCEGDFFGPVPVAAVAPPFSLDAMPAVFPDSLYWESSVDQVLSADEAAEADAEVSQRVAAATAAAVARLSPAQPAQAQPPPQAPPPLLAASASPPPPPPPSQSASPPSPARGGALATLRRPSEWGWSDGSSAASPDGRSRSPAAARAALLRALLLPALCSAGLVALLLAIEAALPAPLRRATASVLGACVATPAARHAAAAAGCVAIIRAGATAASHPSRSHTSPPSHPLTGLEPLLKWAYSRWQSENPSKRRAWDRSAVSWLILDVYRPTEAVALIAVVAQLAAALLPTALGAGRIVRPVVQARDDKNPSYILYRPATP